MPPVVDMPLTGALGPLALLLATVERVIENAVLCSA